MIPLLLIGLTLAQVDSLQHLLFRPAPLETVEQLVRHYRAAGLPDSAGAVLTRYSRVAPKEQQAELALWIADDRLFALQFAEARDAYTQVVMRYPAHDLANDALERLFLLEEGGRDTLALQRLARALGLFAAGFAATALESLQLVTATRLGDHALYHQALIHRAGGASETALACLDVLALKFPSSRLHHARLLKAELLIQTGRLDRARDLLEEIVIAAPNSVCAAQARALLATIAPLH